MCELAVMAWRSIFVEWARRLGDDLADRLRPDREQSKKAQVRDAFDQHPGCMLVTELEGRIVGFITFFFVDQDQKIGEIGNNAVHPDFQGRGLARQQYRRVFEELRNLGAEYVRVTTGLDDAHAPARRAYEAVGFDRALPQVTYYREL